MTLSDLGFRVIEVTSMFSRFSPVLTDVTRLELVLKSKLDLDLNMLQRN